MSRKTISTKSAEAEALRLAAFEGEVPELDRSFFEGARIRVGNRILREATGTFTKRGRPPLGGRAKVQQSLRLSPDVIEHFRGTGPGWQRRINEVLERHIAEAGRRTHGAVAEEQSGFRAKEAEDGE